VLTLMFKGHVYKTDYNADGSFIELPLIRDQVPEDDVRNLLHEFRVMKERNVVLANRLTALEGNCFK